MNDNDVRDDVLSKLSLMADAETTRDLLDTYFELKDLLRDYKTFLSLKLIHRKESNNG